MFEAYINQKIAILTLRPNFNAYYNFKRIKVITFNVYQNTRNYLYFIFI